MSNSSWWVNSAPGKFDGLGDLDPQLEAEFEVLFGERPEGATPEKRAEATQWDQQRKYFKGITMPDFPPQQIENAMATLEAWGFDRPVFYNHRYEVLARFPNTPVNFTPNAAAVVGFTHQTIASWQVREIKAGRKQLQVNPLVPFKYVKMNEEL